MLPQNATRFVVASSASGIDLGTLRPGSSVTAFDRTTQLTATLGGGDITFFHVSVLLKTIPGLDVPNLVLEQTTLTAPLQLSATPATGTINLDKSRFDGIGTVVRATQLEPAGKSSADPIPGDAATLGSGHVYRQNGVRHSGRCRTHCSEGERYPGSPSARCERGRSHVRSLAENPVWCCR